MKTKVPPDAASRSKALTPSSPPQQLTAEQVLSAQRRRVIDRATRRMKKQHQSRLERSRKIKVHTKTATPEVPARLPATDQPPAVAAGDREVTLKVSRRIFQVSPSRT